MSRSYYRWQEQESERKASNQVEIWLQLAHKVDNVARSLVETCIDEVIGCAAEDEKDWLRAGLGLFNKVDTQARLVSELMETIRQKSPAEEPGEIATSRRFQEFAELCLQIAGPVRSSAMD